MGFVENGVIFTGFLVFLVVAVIVMIRNRKRR